MARDIEIQGLKDLTRLSDALRQAGDQGKGLKRELYAGLNRETKQVRKDMRNAITPALPHRGGLASRTLKSTRFGTSTSTGRDVGVRIRVRGKNQIARMNRTGEFWHPVFGNREPGIKQSAGIEKGFLDDPFQAARPDLQRAVVAAIARIRNDLYRSI